MGDKRKHGRKPFKQIQEELKSQPVLALSPYAVMLTATAEQAYLEMLLRSKEAESRGEIGNDHCRVFRAVDEVIRKIIPAEPVSRKFALHKPLDGFYRVAKGRLRIVWFADPDLRAALVIYVSNDLRKDGDARDPYAVLNAMAKAGYLQTIVEDWRRAFHTPPDAPIN